jgi:3-methyl-2-oxobutanoate hydroxymethyltransferase
VRNFAAEGLDIRGAFAAYDKAVKDGSFPAAEHCF